LYYICDWHIRKYTYTNLKHIDHIYMVGKGWGGTLHPSASSFLGNSLASEVKKGLRQKLN
ncbi:hypothetical protein, partial [Amphibacillus marinus]|uniref:hypothetical protein n=1 Tax=Amphibacillus marinus TaxID=872970 RepID=UPI001C4352C3